MRYWNSDRTKSVPGWYMRSCLLLAYPFVLLTAFCVEIARGASRGWTEMKLKHETFVHYWQEGQ